jgi:DNA topoisomerase-1
MTSINKINKKGNLSSFVKVPTDTLLIVESPAKCSTILKYLGPGYRCVATMGHMRYLDGLDSVDVKNNYKLKFTVMESKKSQIKKIQSEIKLSAKIVVATDDDREGESIAWHICDMFHLPIDKTERIVFHEITKDALEYAVKHPIKINMNLVHSAHARQILDLLIGYKISPFLWQHISSEKGSSLSAGRCQTPALRIVYENEIERLERLERLEKIEKIEKIEKMNEKELHNLHSSYSYSVVGFFTKFNLQFSLTTLFETIKIIQLEDFLKASIHENTRFILKYTEKPTMHVTKPPEPFTTSRLQQMASNEFAFSPSETMEICQTLYERGYITYIRTTGKNYSAEFINTHAIPFIREKWGPEYAKSELNSRSGSESESGSECVENDTVSAHEAIRPTDIMRFALTGDYHAREQKIYKLIWRNTVESCMSDYTFSSLNVFIETNILIKDNGDGDCEQNQEDRFFTFSHTCHKPIFYGWKAVQGFTKEQPQQPQHIAMDYLQNIRNLSEISCNKIETRAVFSSLLSSSHYTEARLIHALEEKEIGRPSTFSAIIEKIKERDYVKKQNIQGESIECVEHIVFVPEKKISQNIVRKEIGNEKNKLTITSLGKHVCEFLISHFPRIFSYEYTKQMEAELDDIACKKTESSTGSLEKLKRVCDDCFREIGENIHNYNSEIKEKKTKLMIKNDDNLSIKESMSDCEYVIGNYGGFDITLKNGRFGKYVIWGKNGIHRKSFQKTQFQNKKLSEISLDEIIRFIENDSNDVDVNVNVNVNVDDGSGSGSGSGIIRIINDDISIRNGKYGNYIFYKTMKMKKPRFISLKNFEKDIYTCSESDFISIL